MQFLLFGTGVFKSALFFHDLVKCSVYTFYYVQSGKGALAKAVGVIDATADAVFEVLLNTERQQRYE